MLFVKSKYECERKNLTTQKKWGNINSAKRLRNERTDMKRKLIFMNKSRVQQRREG